MGKKVVVLLLVSILAILATLGCSRSEPANTTNQPSALTTNQPGLIELSLDELSKYNGENGNPAYVAVDGVIYDVSKSTKWQVGKHCKFGAGSDLTEEIKNESPHGIPNITKVPAIGKIVEK